MGDVVNQIKYQTKVNKITQLDVNEIKELEKVQKKFVYRSNNYYNSLINWNDPKDPLRRLVIPDIKELEGGGLLDPSNEAAHTKTQGLEHKYQDTALILFNKICGAYCRYCFRKRLFMNGNDDIVTDLTDALNYISKHKEINNVLITGGDPLVASTSKIEPVIKALREMEHVKIIRIGTKMLSFNPYRVLDDPKFVEMIKKYSLPEKRIYIMSHFTHPNEITPQSIEAVRELIKVGAIVTNQTPMICGINDSVETMVKLFEKLSFMGVPPYYIFGCRPTEGNKTYSVRIERALKIFEQARIKVSGLAARARFVMSHSSGKIEVLGMTEDKIMFRYHRASIESDRGKVMVYKRNPEALWFDDYEELIEEYRA